MNFELKVINVVLSVVLIMHTLGACMIHSQETSMSSTPEMEQVSLLALLSELGDAQDRYFTIEEAWQPGEPMNSMEAYQVTKGSLKTPVLQRLKELQQVIPHFTFEINQKSPHIIHIIDKRLVGQNGYALEQVLKEIDFKGKTRELVSAIAAKGVTIEPQNTYAVGVPFEVDWTTEIHVNGEGLKVRDALTNFIPLEGYKRTIWVATTKLGRGETTFVNFLGPRKSPVKQ
jgi:hypothetical protein